MNLKLEDFRSQTWKRLTLDLEARLGELRKLNDQPVHDQIKTAAIRGQIAEVKRMLALVQASANEEDDPEA